MKYLDKAPFSGRANTPEFRKNYDKIVWDKKPKAKRCGHGRWRCKICQWERGYPIEWLQAGGVE